MSIHRFTIDINVDDEALDEHDGESVPPPNDVHDWEASDIFDAINQGIVDADETNIVYYDGVQKEDK